MKPWEIHPALVHFPIAFLIGGVLLDFYGAKKFRPDLVRNATRLLQAGAATGIVTAAAGLLAFFTVPGHHAEWAHQAILYHLGLAATGLVVVSVAAWMRRGDAAASNPTPLVRGLGVAGVLILGAASWIGGTTVYHGGMGVDPDVVITKHEHAHN